MSNKCIDCKYWFPKDDLDNIMYMNHADGWSRCNKITHADQFDPEDNNAYTMDGSDYASGLFTKEDFGCILFEKRND